MNKLKKRGMLALLLACLAVVSLVPGTGMGAPKSPTVYPFRMYLTEDALANAGNLGGILLTHLMQATDPDTGLVVAGTSSWVQPGTIPKFGGVYAARFDPTDTVNYNSAYFNITISQMAGYSSSTGTVSTGAGNALGPQHHAKAKTTIYSAPGGKSIGSLSAGQQVQVMYIVSGMACLVSGGFVDYNALELIHGEKR